MVALLSSLFALASAPNFAKLVKVGSEKEPTQVRLSYGEVPTTTMRVVWQTQIPTTVSLVEYGTSADFGNCAAATRRPYAYETGAIVEATLYHLQPHTTYYYRVGNQTDGWSKTFQFQTADANPNEFRFTAYGDHGISEDAAKNVQNVLFEKPAFHLLLGDISYANGNQPIWDQYLTQIEPMTSVVPYMLAYGNHENEDKVIEGKSQKIGYISTLARFAMPGYELMYSFDYGNARFVTYNSDDFRNPTQLVWLDQTLAAARQDKKIKWLIVFEHHPLYGTSKGRGDNQDEIKAVGPILDRYKVDLVLAGHDHHYERQYPMRANEIVSREQSTYKKGVGTLFLTQGGGGKSLYDFSDPKPEKCAYRERTTGYVRITVRRRGSLTIEAMRIDRSIMETININE
jgi:3',5'-cyclic AMP phosphodiesterase CpdA